MAFWRSYAHLVWATKDREHFIVDKIESRLFAQIVKKAAEIGCYVHVINGVLDHIHIVITIPPRHSVSFVVKELKGASSHFVNHIIKPPEFHFAWQRGYGYLMLGETQLESAIKYVENQKEHHANSSTNGWLERYSELDEGPDLVPFDDNIRVLGEEKAIYNALGISPF